MKFCRVCAQDKPLDDFYRRKDSPDGYRNDCKECNRSNSRKYYHDHQDHCKARHKLWVEENKDRVLKYLRNWRKENGDKQYAYTKQWRKDNPEKQANHQRKHYMKNRSHYIEKGRQWYQENRESVKARTKKYRQENRELYRVAKRNYYTRKNNNGGDLSLSDWEGLLEFYGGACLCCGSKENIHMDHITPVSKGGPTSLDNVQPLCGTCNLSKQDKEIDYRRHGA